MTRWVRFVLPALALCVMPSVTATADSPARGAINGDLGMAGCVAYAANHPARSSGDACIVAYRTPDDGVLVTVRTREGAIVHGTLPASSLRFGASPENYRALLLDGDVPGVGNLRLYAISAPFRWPAYSNVGCLGYPLTVTVAGASATSDSVIAGFVNDEQVVRWDAGCSALFDGPTVGEWHAN
jgi:hypothetical protein